MDMVCAERRGDRRFYTRYQGVSVPGDWFETCRQYLIGKLGEGQRGMIPVRKRWRPDGLGGHTMRQSLAWLETLGQDLRLATRSLRKSPGFLAIVVLSLALGIGANSTIFSVIDTLLYRPL